MRDEGSFALRVIIIPFAYETSVSPSSDPPFAHKTFVSPFSDPPFAYETSVSPSSDPPFAYETLAKSSHLASQQKMAGQVLIAYLTTKHT